ncbi:hypothetical protein HDU86_007326 [Geranomyces michiganensis]|nr:hypothetical protein HDU86_007326 [Geranomyces michiganensis]
MTDEAEYEAYCREPPSDNSDDYDDDVPDEGLDYDAECDGGDCDPETCRGGGSRPISAARPRGLWARDRKDICPRPNCLRDSPLEADEEHRGQQHDRDVPHTNYVVDVNMKRIIDHPQVAYTLKIVNPRSKAKTGDRLFKELLEYDMKVARRHLAKRMLASGVRELVPPPSKVLQVHQRPGVAFLNPPGTPLGIPTLSNDGSRKTRSGKVIPQLRCGIKLWLGLSEQYEDKGEQLLHTDSYNFKIGRRALESELLAGCDIVVCTPYMLHAWANHFEDFNMAFDTILVDEGSSFIGSELLSVLSPSVEKMIIFGDRLRLGQTIMQEFPESKPAAWNFILEVMNKILPENDQIRPSSQLLERWGTSGVPDATAAPSSSSSGIPDATAVSSSSTIFGENESETWKLLGEHIASGGAVIDVPNGREFRAGKNLTSMANHQEADLTRHHRREMMREGGVKDGDIGVLTPYQAQKSLLRSKMPGFDLSDTVLHDDDGDSVTSDDSLGRRLR